MIAVTNSNIGISLVPRSFYGAITMKRFAILLGVALTSVSAQAGGLLSASDLKGARIKQQGRIVISNDKTHITAFQLHNDIRTALVKLRSMPSLAYRPFGSAVYDSKAPINSPVPVYLAPIFAEAAQQHGLDARLLAAVARRESRFTSSAVSPVGARGVMQLMPGTAEFLGVTDSFDARQNIFGGAKYLRMLLDTFRGDLDLSLAAYNAGPGAVRKYRGIPPYRETMAYVAAIRSDYEASLHAHAR